MRAVIIAAAAVSAACLPGAATATPVPAPSVAVLASTPVPSSLATQPPTARPSPTVHIVPPVSGGPLPEAGVLVVRDAVGTLYRYDGATGAIERLTPLSAWTIARQTASGVYEIGTHGGALFVPWSGAPRTTACSDTIIAISATGACVTQRYDPVAGVYVHYPPAPAVRILPADWGAGIAEWDPSSRRLAITRTVDQRCMRCLNALYVVDADGTPRLLYDTHDRTAVGQFGAVARMLWSSTGDLLVASLSTGCAGCDSTGGYPLLLLDPASGARVELGTTPLMDQDVAWSANGDLAFASGTFDRRAAAMLELRRRDGRVSDIDRGGIDPAWSAGGDRLAWVRSDGTGAVLDLAAGERKPVRCADGRVAGIQFAADDAALLLLCRLPGTDLDRYTIRYVDGSRDTVLVDGVGGGLAYIIPADFFGIAAWSRGVPRG